MVIESNLDSLSLCLIGCIEPENLLAVRTQAASLLLEVVPKVQGGVGRELGDKIKDSLSKYREEGFMPLSQYTLFTTEMEANY